MTVSFLPIVGRELRVAARRKITYVTRCLTAAAVFLIGAWFFMIMTYAPPATLASILFRLLSGAALLYAFLSGVHFTADCLSEEKREGTLGLLFLTDLKGYDVVLGKLFATSLSAFYGLLAMLPLMAVPLLIGGVSLAEVARMSLVVVNTMLMSLTAGLFVSSMSRAPRQASGLTFLLLATFAAILPLIGLWAYSGPGMPGHWPLVASPGYAYAYALDGSYNSEPYRYWISMGVIHGFTWSFLLGASLIAPKSWKDKPVGVKLSLRDRLSALSYGRGEKRAAFRRALLSVNPFYWLASRSRSKPVQVWLVLFGVGAFWGWQWAKHRDSWLDEGIFITTALILNVLLKGWFSAECTRQLSEDRHRGALELMLSTPLSVREILRGQRLALQRQFLAPMVTVLGIYILFMFSTRAMVHDDDSRNSLTAIWVIGILMFIADVIAIYWVGIWMALKVKRTNQAPAATSFIVLVLPWILFALSMLLIASSPPGGNAENVVMFFWAVTGFGVDLFAILVGSRTVLDNFRTMATMRIPGKA